MNGIQAELNPCSGNSTVSDFRLNKGTMFYFYPCLRKEGWLTRTPELLLVPHMCGECVRVCVWKTEETDTGLRQQRWVHAGAAWGALICRLPSPDQGPDSCSPQPPSSICPSPAGLPSSSPAGKAARWNEQFPFRDRKPLCRLGLRNACSLCQINTLSFPLCATIAREQKKGRRGVFVCVCVCLRGECRVLAVHLMIFALAVYWVSECCWRKNGERFA